MEYQIIEKKGYYIVKVLGKFNRKAIYSVRQNLEPLLMKPNPIIVIDMGELTVEEAELIYQIGLLTAIRKGVKLAGGTIKICSLKPNIMGFLHKNRLDVLFDLYENLDCAEQNYQRM
ncbi:MAG: hypothetical protein SVR08_16360 [Spirochaetota bacterium]|nr:hypothetical protein [Spirochaetota bacterium]